VTIIEDLNNVLQGNVQVGDPFFGQFTFDPDTPDSVPQDPASGHYEGAITGWLAPSEYCRSLRSIPPTRRLQL